MSFSNQFAARVGGAARSVAGLAFCAAAVVMLAQPARASLSFENGDFSVTTPSTGGGQLGDNINAEGWTTTGYNFLYPSGTADTTGEDGSDGNVKLWGPNDGSDNGLPASSPVGGNFVAADGAFEVGAITQTISGMTPGDVYAVTFWWAGAQQTAHTGPTTEQWDVSLGSVEQSTVVLDNASEGFTGWIPDMFVFTPTSSSEVLSFLAVGTPSGVPPFSLLAGVTFSQVPEPTASALTACGFTLLGAGLIFRKKRRS
jgi:hypothetical protein